MFDNSNVIPMSTEGRAVEIDATQPAQNFIGQACE
jgi:hypothetical protein